MATELDAIYQGLPPHIVEMYKIGTCYKCKRELTEQELIRSATAQVFRCCADCWEIMQADVTRFSEEFVKLNERLNAK